MNEIKVRKFLDKNFKETNEKENFYYEEISLIYKVKINNFENFSFLIKKIIFLIEQKTLSLINTKPININLIYEG